MTSKPSNTVGLPNSKTCFVCGEENAAGLQTRFYVEDGVVKTRLNAKPHHCGYFNVVHGGVVAAVLDECMGWAGTLVTERMSYTADLTIRYLKPVPADRELIVSAEVVRAGKRMVHVRGRITDGSGEEYVRGEGRYLPLSVEQTLEVDDNLLYRGGEERVFDKLRTEQSRTQGE